MVWERTRNFLFEKNLQGISWVEHFITARDAGDLRSPTVQEEICKRRKIDFSALVTAEQIHGNKVYRVEKKDAGQKIMQVDGLITKVEHIPLAIFTADCLPIFFVDKENRVVGLVHAGRESTFKRIAYETVKRLVETFNSNPANVLVAVGPHIRSCCYPVDLTTLNCQQLLDAGIRKKNMFLNSYCTSCHNDLFFSFHKEREKAGRMLSLIMLN